MLIEIGKFKIHSDKYCLWVTKEIEQKRKKDGSIYKTDKRVSGYTVNFEQLLKSFLGYKLRGVEAKTVKEVLQNFADAEAELLAIINKVDKDAVKREEC